MPYVLTDALILFAGYNLSGDLNKVSVGLSADENTDTAFGDTFHSRPGGQLADVELSAEGWYQSAALNAPDPQAINALGVAGRVVTVCDTSAAGAVAYMLGIHTSKYTHGDQVGAVLPFSLTGSGSSGVGAARGRLLLPSTALSGDTTGTGVQLGAVSASQAVYTSIHCLTAGTTATVIVESDDNSDFSSATTRSSTEITAVGGTGVAPVAGAITDDYWRVRVGSVTGSFVLAVAVGIK